MTEKEQFENNKVLLWGLKQASKKLLDEYDKGNKNPYSLRKQRQQQQEEDEEEEEQQPQQANVRVFDPEEAYSPADLDFLNQEYERIEDLLGKEQDEDKYEELEDLQDKLYNLIEGLEAMKRLQGRGFETDTKILKHLVKHITDKKEPVDKQDFKQAKELIDEIKKTKSGKGFKKGSPEALAQAEKMRKAKEAKYPEVKRTVAVKQTSKARVEKGSEQAKELGKRLAEARKAKQALKPKEEPKPKKNKSTMKPYYYIGTIPKGYREATEDEAIQADKVSEYGKYKVDMNKYNLYKKYSIILNPNLNNNTIYVYLSGMKRRILKLLEEIEKVRLKVQSEKYKDKKEENQEKLDELKDERKHVSAGYNWYYKLLMERLGKPYKRQKIELPVQELKITKKEEKKEEPKPAPKTLIEEVKEIIPKQTKYYFETKTRTFDIPIKAFDDNMKLKTKHINKLLEKGILLLPKYYKDEDAEAMFGKIVGTGMLSLSGLESLFKGFEFAKEKIGSYAKAWTIGRGDEYAPYIRDILKRDGDKEVKEIYISRTPVQSAIKQVLNVLSLGKVGKRMERKNYDDLFHLRIYVVLENGKRFAIEKNEKINISQGMKTSKDEEIKHLINIPEGTTMNSLLQGAQNIQGDKFFKYSGYDNNCQDFILAILNGSNIGDAEDRAFVKQDTKSLFDKYGYLVNIMDKTTDFAGHLNELIYGAGVVKRKPDKSINKIVQSVYFEKEDGWNKTSAKKWLKDNGFYNRMLDDKPTQLRFRQYNPEDLHIDRYYITETREYRGKPIHLVVSLMNKGLTKGGAIYDYLNPMKYALANKSTRGLMNKAGDITRDNLLPLAVDVGKPALYGFSGLASTALTGNPLYGVAGAKLLWDKYGSKYAPKQKSELLKVAGSKLADKVNTFF